MSENNLSHGYPRFAEINSMAILANCLATKSGYKL